MKLPQNGAGLDWKGWVPDPRPGTIFKGSSSLSTSLGSKTLNTLGLGGGGAADQNQRPGCRRTWPGYFSPPLGGHKGQLAPRCRALDAMIKKLYHGIQKAVHQFMFKNVEQHPILGSGGNQNLRPSCRRPPTRTFHTPVGTLRLDAPALV